MLWLVYAGSMVPTLHPSSTSSQSEALVVGVYSADGAHVWGSDSEYDDVISHALEALAFDAASESVLRIPAPAEAAASVVYIVGFDASTKNDGVRTAAATALRAVTGATSVDVRFPILQDGAAQAAGEGALLGAHSLPHRKTSAPAPRIETIAVVGANARDCDRATSIAQAVTRVRDLVAEAPNTQTPAHLASTARDIAEAAGLTVTVLDEDALRSGGFGGISAVGAGSVNPPRYVEITYSPEGAERRIELVGKGITFDSGGLSLKPAASMVGMKYDMTGAATVLAVVVAAAELRLPIAVTARLCIAENMPSGTAARPNDVITMLDGTTVEITNTDAEGRLVLADGLVAASRTMPDAIIDIATLTGAARIALGDRIAGLMGHGFIVDEIQRGAVEAGEEVWAMPLPSYLKSILASDVADLANAKPGNTAAGMLVGGYFLQQFVGTTAEGTVIPWAHLDIAGPANNAGAPYGVTPKGATGTMVRTLLATLENLCDSVPHKE